MGKGSKGEGQGKGQAVEGKGKYWRPADGSEWQSKGKNDYHMYQGKGKGKADYNMYQGKGKGFGHAYRYNS